MNIRSVLAVRDAWTYAKTISDLSETHPVESLFLQNDSPDGTPHWKTQNSMYAKLNIKKKVTAPMTIRLCIGFINRRRKKNPSDNLKIAMVIT